MVFANNNDRMPIIKGLVDELKMQAQFNQPAHYVSIAGNVRLPGDYPYQPHMRISDLLRAALNFQPATDMQYALIKRHHQAQNHIEVLSFALQDVLNHKGTDADLKLQHGDEVTIFKLSQERQSLIANIVTSLKDQARYDQPEPVVTIKGNVKYPGAYPLAANMKVSDLVRASLDLLPDTDMQYALLRRESPGREGVTLLPLSLDKVMHSNPKALNPRLQPRDQLIVLSLTDQRNELIGEYITELRRQARQNQPEPIVTIQGNVRYPGDYPLAANMRVGDLVRAALDLLPETDRQYALLQRLSEDDITTIIPIELHKILSNGDHKTNVILRPRDKLLVFTKNTNRRIAIDSLVNDLNRQARLGQPALVVKINGMVEEQGAYPLTTGMRVSDLILAAGGLEEAAYTMTAEITRYVIGQDSQLNASHQTINLGLAMAGDLSENLLLEPHDTVTIKQAPDWSEEKYITISGEVSFPGVYPITKGETLSQVVMRAGGIADLGDMQAAVFSRQSLRDREDEKKQQLIEEMERDIAILEQSANYPVEAVEPYDKKTSSALLSMQYAVSQVKQSGSIGRLVINLPGILAKQEKDIILKHGDMLYIPQQIQEIAVVGEVMNPSSVLYTPTITLEEYIQASGGLTSKADQSRIYVVKSNGAVVTTKPATTNLFSLHSGQVVIEAGDVIMVPMDLEHVSDLAKWTDISQITYRFALAAEALNTLGIF
jgi:protein involved in polysaccharide export with SLBB domain